MKHKVGFGYDIHRLEAGRKLFLGGVNIPFPRGLAGHSDGDCLIHAVMDAILGACAEEDIGRLFPDTDKKFKNVRSLGLLRRVVTRIQAKNFHVENVDAVIVAQEPLLAPHIPRMKRKMCPVLGLEESHLGIKAKTNEGLGLIGREKAIACWAVVLVGGDRSGVMEKGKKEAAT